MKASAMSVLVIAEPPWPSTEPSNIVNAPNVLDE